MSRGLSEAQPTKHFSSFAASILIHWPAKSQENVVVCVDNAFLIFWFTLPLFHSILDVIPLKCMVLGCFHLSLFTSTIAWTSYNLEPTSLHNRTVFEECTKCDLAAKSHERWLKSLIFYLLIIVMTLNCFIIAPISIHWWTWTKDQGEKSKSMNRKQHFHQFLNI